MGCQVDVAWLRGRSSVAGEFICGCCAVLQLSWFGVSKVESASAASAASISSICVKQFFIYVSSRGDWHMTSPLRLRISHASRCNSCPNRLFLFSCSFRCGGSFFVFFPALRIRTRRAFALVARTARAIAPGTRVGMQCHKKVGVLAPPLWC